MKILKPYQLPNKKIRVVLQGAKFSKRFRCVNEDGDLLDISGNNFLWIGQLVYVDISSYPETLVHYLLALRNGKYLIVSHLRTHELTEKRINFAKGLRSVKHIKLDAKKLITL